MENDKKEEHKNPVTSPFEEIVGSFNADGTNLQNSIQEKLNKIKELSTQLEQAKIEVEQLKGAYSYNRMILEKAANSYKMTKAAYEAEKLAQKS